MGIFSYDGKVFHLLRRMTDFLCLGFLTLICCIPIVTIGASVAAMYAMAFKLVRHEECYVGRQFFRAFRENFKKATILWLILAVVGLLFYVDFRILDVVELQNEDILRKGLFVILVVCAVIGSYFLPLQSYFENTVKNTVKNACIMGIANPVYSLIIIILCFAPSLLVYYYPITIPFVLLFGFSVICYLHALIFQRVFQRCLAATQKGTEGEKEERSTKLP